MRTELLISFTGYRGLFPPHGLDAATVQFMKSAVGAAEATGGNTAATDTVTADPPTEVPSVANVDWGEHRAFGKKSWIFNASLSPRGRHLLVHFTTVSPISP